MAVADDAQAGKQALWSVPILATVADGAVDGAVPEAITGVSIDTRTIEPGDLFVALKDQRDGHEFVTAAFKAGAAAALVSKRYERKAGDGCLVRVDDPLSALGDVARVARFRTDAHVVAVTGSVGKTGTKEMLKHCLALAGATHASEKSYNNHWGVPLTLARMPSDTAYGVFEIGMSNRHEIAPLARMVAPDVGIITTVEGVHLAQFNSIDEIAEEKGDLLLGMSEGGTAILNRDNRYFYQLAARVAERGLKLVSFGVHKDAHVKLLSYEVDDQVSHVTALVRGVMVLYSIGAPGRHYAMNSLAVAAAIDALGAPLETCLEALKTIAAPAGRGAREEIAYRGGKILLVDESYNANPVSMAAALANLGAVPRERFGRRIAILGDMRELGEAADDLHRGLAGPIEAADADLVFACGPHMRALYEALPAGRRGGYAEASLDLIGQVVPSLRPGDVVVVKGSLGTNMAPLVKAVRDLADQSA